LHTTLGSFLRRLVLPRETAAWSLTSLKERAIKVGARLAKHARRLTFQMVEASLTRGMLARMHERVRLGQKITEESELMLRKRTLDRECGILRQVS